MKSYFDQQIQRCQEEKAAMMQDGREDEAVFAQIRGNVFGIFKTIWDLDRGEDFFLQKLQAIPAQWRIFYETAKLHNDVAAMTVERIKLDTARQIQQALEEHA